MSDDKMTTNNDPAEKVVDKWHMVYLCAVLFGTAMLFPYNAFIATPPYVKSYYKYASGNQYYNTSMPHVWANIENYLMVASLVPNFAGQIALMTPFGRSLPLYPRFIVSLILMVVMTLVIIVVPAIKVSEGVALATLLISVAMTNLGAAVFQASMFSFAAFFPFMITQGVMLGIGVSGSLASLLATTIKKSMGSTFAEDQEKAQIYFGIAIGLLVVSFVALLLVRTNRYAKAYITEWMDQADWDRMQEEGNLDEGDALVASPSTERRSPMQDTKPLEVLKKVWPMVLSVFWVFFISLFVFPSFGVKIDAENGWFGVLIILMFNLGDFSGRFLCRFPCLLLENRKVVQGGCAARTLLVVLFFLCLKPKVIDSVPFAYVLMYVTGVTNGYFGSHCMMLAPSSPGLKTDGERGVTGNAMSVALLAGAAVGSLVSLAIVPQL